MAGGEKEGKEGGKEELGDGISVWNFQRITEGRFS